MDVTSLAGSSSATPQATGQAAATPADRSTAPAPSQDPKQPENVPMIDAIAKIFGDPGQPHSVSLNVSYRVTHNPNDIVTVFSDPKTGQEVAQFPAEIVIQMAEFFDKYSGITLDSSV
ncbi:MAG TPA: hypothetical protein VIG51_01015 [Candidatus Baltobacteraceae bacterium]|jgi:uncharacterized FlaG/YvyC family protein